MGPFPHPRQPLVASFDEFAQCAQFSLMAQLNAAPDAAADGDERAAREVRSGHFVPVMPTPLPRPRYMGHSRAFFKELGLSDQLVFDEKFCRFFSGDCSVASEPLKKFGWATGYALSIYGTEYQQQCPFGTGNGYGDGRAISVFEGVLNGQRWEMQLKGAGPTPYCRGADGRAVLRSSVREFLAQEHMHALGIPTSRSLTLFVSETETVMRPWYSHESFSREPDIFVANPVAISTRVAPSFLRVGQIELFARRARSRAHPLALEELRMIVLHLIDREYRAEISPELGFASQLVELAKRFRDRLTSLVAQWLRVGYCQGNFNSDNCAAGGFTLDYGPFGFCEDFDLKFQPWTGGGLHFSFFNQPLAAEANFHMFWKALRILVEGDDHALESLEQIRSGFAEEMQQQLQSMWARKLGLSEFQPDLVNQLFALMSRSKVDYTIFFRELSSASGEFSHIEKSFYDVPSQQEVEGWKSWLRNWKACLDREGSAVEVSQRMKQANPKYTWREWQVVPAYESAMRGDTTLLGELQDVLSNPYDEQSAEVAAKHYRLKPRALFNRGGISHYSCSS